MSSQVFLRYFRLFAALAGVILTATFSQQIFSLFHHSPDHETITTFFSAALIFVLSFGIFYLAQGTVLPNFVIAIFFGLAAKPLLLPVVENQAVLSTLVAAGATLILFGGGLETPFINFRKLLFKILSIAIFGLLITAIGFSFAVVGVSALFGSSVTIVTAVLLGAILASTDPAAIIPVLKRLRFHNPAIKDIIVSESAVTDVTGTLLTVAFLALLGAGTFGTTVLGSYSGLLSSETLLTFGRQVLFGSLFGVLGYGFLTVLLRMKSAHDREYEADAAFFLFIPVIIFTFAIAFGGSGYLAAFVAGLLFVMSEHLQETERFFNHMIDGFFKPIIFLLLGALIDPSLLVTYAPLGIAAALLFIFAIRPLAVFLTLGWFCHLGKERLLWKELFFISFVRETGAIPAVLLVTIASQAIPGTEALLPIGMWVILLTLSLQPPLTPYVAKKFGVAEAIPDAAPDVTNGDSSFVVLATRGRSFFGRLPSVAEWAAQHGIPKVLVLLCLEYQHQPELEQTIGKEAEAAFVRTNALLEEGGKRPLVFSFISSAGLLQENIEFVAKKEKSLVAIFVGKKMLDYRMEQIKKLPVPFFFLD